MLYFLHNVLATVSTSVAIPVPTLNTCPAAFGVSRPRMVASTTSSIYTKSLVSLPSSKMLISLLFLILVEKILKIPV